MIEQHKDQHTDEELLASFFTAQKAEIPDNGFSARVMRRLPRHARRLNQIWTTFCFAIAMALFLLFDGIAELRHVASDIIADITTTLASIPSTLIMTVVVGGIISITWLLAFRLIKKVV